jgi:hypothetical protein
MNQKKIFLSRKQGKNKIVSFSSLAEKCLIDQSVLDNRKDMLTQVDNPIIVTVDEFETKSSPPKKPNHFLPTGSGFDNFDKFCLKI